jgi:hypothetical protein
MLGPEEEGKISHVVELEISERSKEVKCQKAMNLSTLGVYCSQKHQVSTQDKQTNQALRGCFQE